MFKLFFNYLKNNLRRSKISLKFPKAEVKKVFFRKKVIGDRKISLFQPQMSIQKYDQLLIKTTKNFRNLIFLKKIRDRIAKI
jgi:hypothetical protein